MTEPALPMAFHDLPPSKFPFVMYFYDIRTGACYEQINVAGPGAVHVPGKPPQYEKVGVRVEFADGETITEEPK